MNKSGAETTKIEMPRYRSHKTVWALKIAEVIDEGTDTTTDENPIVTIWFEDQRFPAHRINLRGKPTPAAGWYFVRYEDGYISFSPAEQFEKGNTLDELLKPIDPEPLPDLHSFSQDEIENWFTYHAPTSQQLVQYHHVRTAAKVFAETINKNVPSGPDKTAAIRKLREAVMTANAGIACYIEKKCPTIEVRAVAAVDDETKLHTEGYGHGAGENKAGS